MSGVVIPFPVPVEAEPEPSCPCERRMRRIRAELRLWLRPWRTVGIARDYERDMTVVLHAWAGWIREHRAG